MIAGSVVFGWRLLATVSSSLHRAAKSLGYWQFSLLSNLFGPFLSVNESV